MENEERTTCLRAAYDAHALERDADAREPWKDAERAGFLAALQQDEKHSLLEIGSGPGRDALFFQAHGLQITCIDLSPANVALCRQKGLTAHIMDMRALTFPEASFEAVYAMNSLLHLAKAELPGVLAGMEKMLKPNGLGYIGVYGGYDHAGIWELDRYTPQRFFSFFTDEAIQRAAAEYFEIQSFHTVEHDPGGRLHFQSLLLRKKT
jgi:SAM-dependent methyltransferase